jgi:hypothetical protein
MSRAIQIGTIGCTPHISEPGRYIVAKLPEAIPPPKRLRLAFEQGPAVDLNNVPNRARRREHALAALVRAVANGDLLLQATYRRSLNKEIQEGAP